MAALTPVEDYLAALLASLPTPTPITVRLDEAYGAVLAQDATALLPVPPWTNSAMDGYAINTDDLAGQQAPVILPVSQDIPAGAAPQPLAPGTAARIMTGAMMPAGANAVLQVELTDQLPGPHAAPTQVELREIPVPGHNVRAAGEDVTPGALVVRAGTTLGGRELSSLASTGHGSVQVFPPVRVGIVSTGSELREPGSLLAPGKIPESNSLLLAGMVRECGAHYAGLWRSEDTAASLAQALQEAAAHSDLVITSGGVSAGAFDPLTMLATQGDSGVDLTFSKLSMQPGKPQAYGQIRSENRTVPLVALPGNPVSVLVSFTTLVRPAVRVLAGLEGPDGAPTASSSPSLSLPRTSHPAPASPVSLPASAPAAIGWSCPPGRRQYVPVMLTSDGMVMPTHRLGSGSHLVASLPAAQALAVVPEHVEAVAPGDEVALIPISTPAQP